MQLVHTDEYYEVHMDGRGIIHLRRSDAPWASLEIAKERNDLMVSKIREAMAPAERGVGLLMDFRNARARNDDAFESLTEQYRHEMRDSFDRVAVVVRTSVGRLQLERLNRGQTNAPALFDDPEAALRWLQATES